MLFRLQFGGRDVDVIKMETRIVYDGVYTYRFNEGANSGVLNIVPASNSRAACAMADVNISFDDAERSTGVIVSGTVTETGPDIDFSIDGVPRPMGRLDVPRAPGLSFRRSAVQDEGKVLAERVIRDLDQLHAVKAGNGRSLGLVIRLAVINGFNAMGAQRLHA